VLLCKKRTAPKSRLSAIATGTQVRWWKEPTKNQWYDFIAAWLGWTLDGRSHGAHGAAFLFFFRALLGIGMGAEWPEHIETSTPRASPT
jgi:hypothetical protein